VAVRRSDAADADLEKIWLDAAQGYGVAHAQRVIFRLDAVFERLDVLFCCRRSPGSRSLRLSVEQRWSVASKSFVHKQSSGNPRHFGV
jgi:hypothetical protein